MTVTGFIAYAQGWGGLYIRANKLAYQQFEKHPRLAVLALGNIPDVPERVHWERDPQSPSAHPERTTTAPSAARG